MIVGLCGLARSGKDTAAAVSQPIDGNPDHADLIRMWDMDPELWEIIGDVQVRRWQAHGAEGEGVRWFRF